ncbi:MAG: hypothetical protein KAS23_02135 [Anaerohalosphaera sp.]|nr:hypothetical protein [Anaerohalosphaera sp.]
MITHRERVQKAIHFQCPDRVPHYLPDGEENDVLWIAPWTGAEAGEKLLPDKQPWTVVGNIERRIDCWGVTWERGLGQEGNMGQAKRYAIEDITKQSEYQFPDLNNPLYYQVRKKMIIDNNVSANPKYALGVMGFSSLNEGTHNIRGLHNMFMDYYENADHLKALISRFAENQRQSIRLLADLGCDGVMGYDDWGLQDSLMVSEDLIEEFFLPHYRKNWALAHELGMDVWLHSCGYIIDLLPRLIDAGLNVIQMDQQENMGLENLSEKVGGKIAFWSPVDIQDAMVRGTESDVEEYVKKMIATLGSHNGGLVSMAYTTPEAVEHRPENTAAMCRAFREFGVYPKNCQTS